MEKKSVRAVETAIALHVHELPAIGVRDEAYCVLHIPKFIMPFVRAGLLALIVDNLWASEADASEAQQIILEVIARECELWGASFATTPQTLSGEQATGLPAPPYTWGIVWQGDTPHLTYQSEAGR